MKKLFLFAFLFSYPVLTTGQSLEFIMDMVHNNQDEKPFITKYNDPFFSNRKALTGLNHNGLLIRV